MAKPQPPSKLRPLLLAGGGLAAVAVILSGVMFVDARRTSVSDADRAQSEAAVARMDAAQARANAARTEAQKRAYKGY
jgi:type VI protein secretion system component VasK